MVQTRWGHMNRDALAAHQGPGADARRPPPRREPRALRRRVPLQLLRHRRHVAHARPSPTRAAGSTTRSPRISISPTARSSPAGSSSTARTSSRPPSSPRTSRRSARSSSAGPRAPCRRRASCSRACCTRPELTLSQRIEAFFHLTPHFAYPLMVLLSVLLLPALILMPATDTRRCSSSTCRSASAPPARSPRSTCWPRRRRAAPAGRARCGCRRSSRSAPASRRTSRRRCSRGSIRWPASSCARRRRGRAKGRYRARAELPHVEIGARAALVRQRRRLDRDRPLVRDALRDALHARLRLRRASRRRPSRPLRRREARALVRSPSRVSELPAARRAPKSWPPSLECSASETLGASEPSECAGSAPAAHSGPRTRRLLYGLLERLRP